MHRRLLFVLMLLAFGLRAWYATVNPLLPQFSNADDGDYYQRALRLVIQGVYLDDAWLIRPPLHVGFFAACIKLAVLLGQPAAWGVRVVQAAQTLMGTAMVPLGYSVTARLFHNRRAGLLFAFFWAIWFPFVDLATTLFSEPLFLFLLLLHLWLMLRYDERRRSRELVAAGLVLGLAALTRSPALYTVVFAVPWLFFAVSARQGDAPAAARSFRLMTRRLKQLMRPLLVLAATALLVVLPWTARNWITYQRFILIDTLGPINLWLDLGETNERDAKIAQLQALPQADRQAFASAQARAILREEPLKPFHRFGENFRATIKAQFIEDFFVKRSTFGRLLRPVAPLGLLSDLMWLVWCVAGIAGILHPGTDRAFKWVMGLWLCYSTVTVLVFHVEPRYLFPIWLILAIYGSWTLAQGWRWLASLRTRPLRAIMIATSIASFLLLFVSYRNYPAILLRGFRREQAFIAGERAFRRNDYPAAERAFRAALAVEPNNIDTAVALAGVLLAEKRPEEGMALIERYGSRESGIMLGALLRATGDERQAALLLSEGERMANVDAQPWTLNAVRPPETRGLVLGNDLDLGYISGFAPSEYIGERTLRWLKGKGEIVLPLPAPLAPGDMALIELAAPVPLDAPPTISINGGPPRRLPVQSQWRCFLLPIPPEAFGQRTLRLQLAAPTFIPMQRDPQSDDARALSIMVHRVAVTH